MCSWTLSVDLCESPHWLSSSNYIFDAYKDLVCLVDLLRDARNTLDFEEFSTLHYGKNWKNKCDKILEKYCVNERKVVSQAVQKNRDAYINYYRNERRENNAD